MYKNINHLKLDLQKTITFNDPEITIHQRDLLHLKTIDKLIHTAVFSRDETLRAKTRKIIWHIAKEKGIYSASIRPLYQAFGNGSVKGFSVPAMNIRMLTYDLARLIFKVAKEQNAGAFIIEIAKSESEYTEQSPDEFATTIMAAAIKEQYSGPVFIQGDHCQFSSKRYAADKHAEINHLKDWIKQLLDAGFRNIDIDGSTLVDLSQPSLEAQQKENAYVTAVMTKFIRENQPDDIDIAIGGEIGHIGDKNSTIDDFTTFMNQYLYRIPRNSGINKVSVQTGTSHGGNIDSSGHPKKMNVDFSVLETIGDVAREQYHLAGPVQHGASTLPLESFNKFVASKTVEVHLSTGFQNIVFDTMPKNLKEEMYRWLKKNAKDEKEESWTEEQFLYRTRKKALGPFKKKLWDLQQEEKQPILDALKKYITTIFSELNVQNTNAILKRYYFL